MILSIVLYQSALPPNQVFSKLPRDTNLWLYFLLLPQIDWDDGVETPSEDNDRLQEFGRM